ncbi:hypothetical protein EDD37DRAFT_617123 [Exophiala viscosa]|uniref:CCZ1/INTU/HSP4 first Longin domain-containing protein n=1 Tax=Exophiala viscosa TaxID=2486360 RepID=A0AAN6E2G5_9EURO|nr:hypothetical protein EDD36DRAFT_430339 [Exophiala viscosa]KAI1629483.1 hypothetical protein EDD37DRAFT_617123 [Exophiala viscosa]
MSTSLKNTSRVTPAQLSYFAIYNPSLGPTDETVRDQIVFYYSKKLEDERERRKEEEPSEQEREQHKQHDDEVAENERLRQVGLAQGMVNFVQNFSNDAPLECVETEKQRIVLKEVEPRWWILAAIDLTKLPPSNTRAASTNRSSIIESQSSGDVEYSSREVASVPLLLAQITQAHRIFMLHHSSTLAELWKKHERGKQLFRDLLQRYWERFIWNWDVLLHGNPATDLYDAVKLAGGGELGIGVGEEDQGSGEREVLEGFVARTEGLLDLVVGRYGDAPAGAAGVQRKDAEGKVGTIHSAPWLGNGEDPRAEDGIIFSGIGGISKRSLITVSKWMEAIFVHGEAAYGVGDNPASRPRHRRKRRKVDEETSRRNLDRTLPQHSGGQHAASVRDKAPNLHRKAMENNATPPGIPPPLVSAVEQSLDNATANASANDTSDEGGKSSESANNQKQDEHGNSLFGTEKMMKYLSLGYGSSWTLSPRGFGADRDINGPSSLTDAGRNETKSEAKETSPEELLQELDPTPEVSDEDEPPFVQRLEQSIGKFLVGLSGDLENAEFEDDPNSHGGGREPSSPKEANRIFLRTLTVEVSASRASQITVSERRASKVNDDSESAKGKTSAAASIDGAQKPNVTHEKVQVAIYVHQPFIFVFLFQLRTSNLTVPSFYRAIHHTLGPLQKSLLRSTDPERWRERVKAALETDPDPSSEQERNATAKEPVEIYDLIYDPAQLTVRTSIPNIPIPGSLAAEGLHRTQPARLITVSGSWYTLGIPIGSSASAPETPTSTPSILVQSQWTRVEALSVHTHILNIWESTRCSKGHNGQPAPQSEELERTVKTARGWWVVWMKVRKSAQDAGGRIPQSETSTSQGTSESGHVEKEAILVRRSKESIAKSRDVSGSRSTSGASFASGRWLLREQPRSREVSGSNSGQATGYGGSGNMGSANARGMNEGVGVDARKWVEGLIKLNM